MTAPVFKRGDDMTITAIRAGIAGLSVGQRIAGAAVGLGLWLAPAAAVWLHMHAKVDAASDVGAANARAECAQRNEYALAQAIRAARSEWERTQAAIDSRAEHDAKTIAADAAAVRRYTSRLSKDLAAYATARPLPADCRGDPDRVRLYNATRRGDASD